MSGGQWKVKKFRHTPATGGYGFCVGEGNWGAYPKRWEIDGVPRPFHHFKTHAEALRFALVASKYGVPLAKNRQAMGCTHPVDRSCVA